MKKMILAIYMFIVLIASADEEMAVNGNVEKIDGSFITVVVNNKKELFKLAPKWYLMENGYFVKEGETVKIRYRKVNNVNSVTEVVRNKKTYKFTDGNGEFLWKRSGIGGKDSETSSKTWQVTGNNTVQGDKPASISGNGSTSTVTSTSTNTVTGVQQNQQMFDGHHGSIIGNQQGTILKPRDDFHNSGREGSFGRENDSMKGKRDIVPGMER